MNATIQLHELPLPGLREDNPRDFLAALGLLRLFGHQWPDSLPALFWSEETGIPVLLLVIEPQQDWGIRLWELLLEWKHSECNPFGHGKIESVEPEIFRSLLRVESDRSKLHARFYASLAAQIPHEKSGRRSEFIIESANRSVLKGIDDLLGHKKNVPNLAADFLGTSIVREVSNTSRWHPAEYQSAAYASTDPKENKHCDRLSLNIVALFGLTYFPAVDTARGRKTPGFRRLKKVPEFSWPVWSSPLREEELGSLLHHPAIHDEFTSAADLKRMGIYQVWRSRKFCPDSKNDYFSTAQPTF